MKKLYLVLDISLYGYGESINLKECGAAFIEAIKSLVVRVVAQLTIAC